MGTHFPFLFIIGLVISVASAFSNNKYIRMIGGIFGMMMMGGVNPFSGSFALTANATARIAAGAFLTTFIVSNGDFGAALVSGITSFVTAQFSMSIGGIPESSGFFGSLPGKAILHGLVGGVASAVGGGKFGSGFIGSFMGLLTFCLAKLLLSQRVCYANCCGKLGGAIGAGWAKALQLAGSAAVTFRTTVAAVFGGMAAKASGGNFAQGAKTAAIQHLFNDELSRVAQKGPFSYDENDPYYHKYEMNNEICSLSTEGCSASAVWGELKKNPAPGWDNSKQVAPGDETKIVFAGMSGGTVSHIVDDANMTLYNVTHSDHIFSDGYVSRSVYVSGGSVYVKSIGEGITSSGSFRLGGVIPISRAMRGTLNMKVYKPGFDALDNNIRSAF